MSPRVVKPEEFAEKREQILAAALRVFSLDGVHGTAVPPIARAANIGIGTLYHYFENKEALVNAVFQHTKSRLHQRLLDGLQTEDPSKALFDEIWDRLAAFAVEEPEAFRFLEMQDHYPYLDEKSHAEEKQLLKPLRGLVKLGQKTGLFSTAVRPEIALALFWGSFVGLFKSERLGYVELRKGDLYAARDACWKMLSK